MRFSTAALVAGLTATASAFLLPPNLDHLKEDVHEARFRGPPKHFKDLVHSMLEQKTTIIDLDCPGCPYAAARSDERSNGPSSRNIVWEQGVDNTIHLEFDTHNNALNVNGLSLLPLERATHNPPTLLKAYQVKEENGIVQHSLDVDLSFVIAVLPAIPSPHNDHVSMIPVDLTVLKMNDIPVKVNTIALKVIKTPDGGYVIVHTEQVSFGRTPGAQTCEGTRPWALCRVKAIIKDKLRVIMEMAREKADRVHGFVKEKFPGCGKDRASSQHPHPHGDHPHGDYPHPHRMGKHHGHHRSNRLSRMIHQTLRYFVVPALLGVIGGLTASAIGMLVGQALVFLWCRFHRNGQRGPLRVYEREIVLVDEEEKGLLVVVDEEALPVYEDAPRYEETRETNTTADVVSQVNEKR